MLKILFHRETLEILGIHCCGASGSRVATSFGQTVTFLVAPSCSLLHVALPVTRGRRFVLTTFFRHKQ